jgi:hypothetical protein
MSYWICLVPVLTTEHLSREAYAAWRKKIASGDRPGAVYQDGMWLWVPSDPEADHEEPQELRKVFDWCRVAGFDHVRFDESGDEWSGLPLYDWEDSPPIQPACSNH